MLLALVAGCGASPTVRPETAAARPGPAPGSAPLDVPPDVPPPSPSASVSLPAGSVALTRSELARVPQFGPPPVAVPMTLPRGASAPWISRIATSQKVAFITIDDGWEKNPKAFALLTAAHVPVTLFLQVDAIRSDVDHFKALVAAGATVEAHTITHQQLKGRSYGLQKREICGSADQLGQWYGRRPTLFRPPFGAKDATTLRVAHDCGMKAVFFWKEATNKGKVYYQEKHVVQPGDVILMHFRPAFVNDFLAVLKAIHDAGLTPARLQDYIPGAA
ncbi:polysaccharide deacetylase family protein [Actinoplanes sp. NBRC 103695]|uniref:polysaccharide deacetylase family protein n=1 Tax=Actinoplanes sp. NBRC 103695 TaxID=3032202 RepID=UPI00255638E8|nr:polysaccharide deacetylase family protein [Actinoplanes sp. NBRC 103695]